MVVRREVRGSRVPDLPSLSRGISPLASRVRQSPNARRCSAVCRGRRPPWPHEMPGSWTTPRGPRLAPSDVVRCDLLRASACPRAPRGTSRAGVGRRQGLPPVPLRPLRSAWAGRGLAAAATSPPFRPFSIPKTIAGLAARGACTSSARSNRCPTWITPRHEGDSYLQGYPRQPRRRKPLLPGTEWPEITGA
jgi:hypothetical protein